MSITVRLKQQIDALPSKPGVYQYFNSADEIIYVGKASDLKKRVSSYFTKKHERGKIRVLVKNIAYLRFIVVKTPEDALLLENNLIKKYQPRYNSMLKDGKTYASICITKDDFPKVFKTRTVDKKYGEYYGPYSSVYTINSILEVVHKIYPIRSCNLNLTKENIDGGKFRVCLQYHIKKCKGPCEGFQSKTDYQKDIEEVRKIIQGDANIISKMLLQEMNWLASHYRYEEAQEVKQKYELIENFKAKSIVANTIIENTDFFGITEDENSAFVNILRVYKGAITQGYTVEYKKKLEETKEEILSRAILDLREKLNSNSKEIVLPFQIDFPLNNVKIVVPQRSDRKKILDLSLQNAKQFKIEKLKQSEKLNKQQKTTQVLSEMQKRLNLTKIPSVVEAFDNSNISGSNAVSVCVVFINGKPSKKDYRKYIIKSVNGPDDYASMKEVVRRRYGRMMEEDHALPDLIIADGGIGQMESIRKVVEDELKLKIPIAGLKKNDKHKTSELLFGFPPKVVELKPTERLFKFLASVQDESHRFAIKFHREKRSKSQIESELDDIKGIGEKTKEQLMNHFKSLKRVRLATIEELTKIIGKHRASIVYGYFNRP